MPVSESVALDALLTLTQTISGTTRIEAIYEAALDCLDRALAIPRASILLFDPDGVMRFKASRNLSPSYQRRVEGHTPWTSQSRDPQPIVVADVRAEATLAPYLDAIDAEGIGAMVFVPLSTDRGVIGKFMLYFDAPHTPDPSELKLASLVAAQVAFAVQRVKAQHAARERELELRLVTDAAPILLTHIDCHGRYRFVNKAYAARFGLRPQDIVGKLIPEVLGEPAYATFRSYVEAVLRGEHVDFELEIPYDKLGPRIMRVQYVPEFGSNGEVAGFVAVILDVTDRRRAEAALRASEASYRDLAISLQQADRQKDEFLAVLAHELRNPLAPIRTALQLIEMSDEDVARRRRACTVMDRQIRQLVRLVDDLLDVSRITRGKIELQKRRVELATIIQDAVDTSRPGIENAGHELTVTFPPAPIFLEGDGTRLAQVFSNLLNNAAKYTERGGSISLTAERRGERAVVRVKDTGVGIPADMLTRVFDLFTQVDRSLEKMHGGLGIGLTLVKRLVEMHGGTVEAASEGPGRGSEFAVSLPAAAAATANDWHDRAAHPTRVAAARRILVVDDNRDAAETLAEMLRMKGHDVRTAHDGLEAVDVARAFAPALVLLDLGMPRLNGYEAAQRIREHLRDRVLIVAVTGWGQPDDRRRTRQAGFDRHLIKPVDPVALDAVLNDLSVDFA